MPKVQGTKEVIITLRLNVEDYEVLRLCSAVNGYLKNSGNPNISEYVRFLIRASILPMRTELRKRGLAPNEAYEQFLFGTSELQQPTND